MFIVKECSETQVLDREQLGLEVKGQGLLGVTGKIICFYFGHKLA